MDIKKGETINGSKFRLIVTNIDNVNFVYENNIINIKTFFSVSYRGIEEGEYKIPLVIEKNKKGTLKVDINRPCMVPNYIQKETIIAVYNYFCHEINDIYKLAGQMSFV